MAAVSRYSCNHCRQEIVFDDKHVSKKTGKSIPLDPQTKEPHQCEVQAQGQSSAATDTLKFAETLSSLLQDYIRLKHAETAAAKGVRD